MKKLLAAGEARIFALPRVFRNRERGALACAGVHHARMVSRRGALRGADGGLRRDRRLAGGARPARGASASAAARPIPSPRPSGSPSATLSCAMPGSTSSTASARDGRDADRDMLAAQAAALGLRVAADDNWSDIFSRILSEKIEPTLGLGRATVLCEYPAREAALARVSDHDPRVADRFELYACGVELANAFGELTDAAEQRRRFEEEMAEKQRVYGEAYPIDEDFLAALASHASRERRGARARSARDARLRRGAHRGRAMDAGLRPARGSRTHDAAKALLDKARGELERRLRLSRLSPRPGGDRRRDLAAARTCSPSCRPAAASRSASSSRRSPAKGFALVVSPLIALMRDQVAQLRELGVSAAALNSASDVDERQRVARAPATIARCACSMSRPSGSCATT